MGETYEQKRIWEMDFFRGIALILMIIFHLVFDLKEFAQVSVNYASGFYYYVGKIAGISFIILAAISCYFSKSNMKRGLQILGMGIAITIVSHIYNPSYGIKFGILHFLGISIIIYPIFKDVNKWFLLVLGTLIIILGNYFKLINMPFDYLFIFGLTGDLFVSADYYPLLPWFGVFLYGIFIRQILYSEKKSLFSFHPRNNIISTLGRHTFIIYLVHQPLILLIIWAVLR